MKRISKIFSAFLVLCLAFSFNGCLISYFYKSALPIKIISVKTYDGQTGEEILGEENQFVWRFAMDEEEKQTATATLSLNPKIQPMNSPAPVFLYYVIDVKPGDIINVEFEVYVRNNKGLSALYLYNGSCGYTNYGEEFCATDITDNGKGNFTVRYTYTVQDNIYYLTAQSWDNKQGGKSLMPSRGGEVYNRGVFFNVNGILEGKGYLD